MADRQIKGTVFSEFGEKTAPAIILIHGLGLNKDVWQWQQTFHHLRAPH